MDVKEVFADLQLKAADLVAFVDDKLKHYTELTIGEKVAYPTIVLGLLLVFISIMLFIL
tara:strand:- start:606 stop:782 length:177 start_codon:yes stop_codon:yes gene_type:complete